MWSKYTYCLGDLAFHILTQYSVKNKGISEFLRLQAKNSKGDLTDIRQKLQIKDAILQPGLDLYLRHIVCGIDEALKLSVCDLLDVHIEGVDVDQPLRTLTVCGDAWVVCSHQELSTGNQNHLYVENKQKHLHWLIHSGDLSYDTLKFEGRWFD